MRPIERALAARADVAAAAARGHGLAATADHWPAIRTAYGWVRQAAHLLANRADQPGAAVHTAYQALLGAMTARRDTLGALASAVDRFHQVTANYAPGFFHCYDRPHLPPTNNALEQYFGAGLPLSDEFLETNPTDGKPYRTQYFERALRVPPRDRRSPVSGAARPTR